MATNPFEETKIERENKSAPKSLMETAGYVTSIYFLFRTIGSFTGSFIMTKISSNKFFIFSVLLMLLGMGCLLFASNVTLVYVCVAMIGYGNSNIPSNLCTCTSEYARTSEQCIRTYDYGTLRRNSIPACNGSSF